MITSRQSKINQKRISLPVKTRISEVPAKGSNQGFFSRQDGVFISAANVFTCFRRLFSWGRRWSKVGWKSGSAVKSKECLLLGRAFNMSSSWTSELALPLHSSPIFEERSKRKKGSERKRTPFSSRPLLNKNRMFVVRRLRFLIQFSVYDPSKNLKVFKFFEKIAINCSMSTTRRKNRVREKDIIKVVAKVPYQMFVWQHSSFLKTKSSQTDWNHM